MRIIAGENRGRRLHTPPGNRVRPTSDQVREALFNILGDINGVTFLDLFAGSGAVAFEALSRGAESVTLVEENNKANKTINENITEVYPDAGDQITVHHHSLPAALNHVSPPDGGFDIIFFDPPYSETSKYLEQMLDDLLGMLSPTGQLVVEGATRDEQRLRDLLTDYPNVDYDDCKRYGDTTLCFLVPSGAMNAS